MLSPGAQGNQTGNGWGRGMAAIAAAPGPVPALRGPLWGPRREGDPSRSIPIDKGGNYISLAFSANPHGAAGETRQRTEIKVSANLFIRSKYSHTYRKLNVFLKNEVRFSFLSKRQIFLCIYIQCWEILGKKISKEFPVQFKSKIIYIIYSKETL